MVENQIFSANQETVIRVLHDPIIGERAAFGEKLKYLCFSRNSLTKRMRVDCTGDVSISVGTGTVRADHVSCKNFRSTGSTGDIVLTVE